MSRSRNCIRGARIVVVTASLIVWGCGPRPTRSVRPAAARTSAITLAAIDASIDVDAELAALGIGEKARGAVVLLRDVTVFDRDPEHLRALRELLADEHAQRAIAYLDENASPAGKVYALVAAWQADPGSYRVRYDALRLHSPGLTVEHREGCLGDTTPMSEFLEPDGLAIQLAPGTPWRSFECSPDGRRRLLADPLFRVDFAGGALPASLLDELEFLDAPQPSATDPVTVSIWALCAPR